MLLPLDRLKWFSIWTRSSGEIANREGSERGAVSEGEPGMSTVIRLLFSLALIAAPLSEGAWAAQKSRKSSGHLGQNDGVIGLVAAEAGTDSMRMAGDLARVLDSEKMRILPIAGRNPVQTVSDLLYLKGIDAIIVPSDVLRFVEKKGMHGDVESRIHYVTKLFTRDLHVIARREVASLKDLDGKKVNLGPEDSSSAITGAAVLEALKISVEATALEPWDALDKLKAGEIDAVVHVAQKPVELLTSISPADGLKLLPVELEGEAGKRYPPALLTQGDYPGLIDDKGEIATVGVGEVLAVFNWQRGGARYSRVNAFVEQFFEKFPELAEPPSTLKWRDVNLAAEVAGLERDDEAEEWIEKAQKAKPASETDSEAEALRTAFRRFLETSGEAAALSANDQKELFERFLQWKEAGGQ